MVKNFRNIKATLIMGILVVSVFAAMIPTTSAGYFMNLTSFINVQWEQNETPIVIPRGPLETFRIEIWYGVNAAGLFRLLTDTLFLIHKDRQVSVKLELVDQSPWCTATLLTDTLTTKVSRELDRTLRATVNIQANIDAPAYSAGFLTIKASVDKIGMIAGFNKEFTLQFNPAYLPLIKPEMPKGNTKRIGPMDTAVFPIEIENLGNARTKVFLEVINVPDDWTAIVTDQITLNEVVGSKGTAYLTVRPPKGFGYHDDSAGIVVRYTPARAENPLDEGKTETISVLVESRGFSIIGIEIILLPIIIIFVVIFLIYYFIFIRKRKT